MSDRSLFCILAVFGIISFDLMAQQQVTLKPVKKPIPAYLAGLNGRSTEGPSWSNSSFLRLVEEMAPGYVRYPAGTIANYWDWHTGNFIEGSGKKTKYPFTIKQCVEGVPKHTRLIYVVNMARPTPSTGISIAADLLVLTSENTLQSKISDMLSALHEFEQSGKLPDVVELGNEFYFLNDHGAIYARNPDLYLNHSKQISQVLKKHYPQIKIILCTTKEGTSGRDDWNNAVFERLTKDVEFRSLISGVVQHHYINENYGSLEPVTDINQAIDAIAEGFTYVEDVRKSYEIVPDGIKLWLTEFGVTKQNMEGCWASGLRSVAFSMAWLEWIDKIENMMWHHITKEPNVIDRQLMELGPVGIAYGLFMKAFNGKSFLQELNFTYNPQATASIDALHGYQLISEKEESILILNIGSESISHLDFSKIIKQGAFVEIKQYGSSTPFQQGMPQMQKSLDLSGKELADFQLSPFSLTLINVTKNELSLTDFKNNDQIIYYPISPDEYNFEIKHGALPIQISLFSSTGELLVSSHEYESCFRISLKGRPVGVYFVVVDNNQKRSCFKIARF